MNEIICPHCQKAFKVDDSGYAAILKQVRDTDFEQQIHDRLELAEQQKANAIELATANLRMALQGDAAKKDGEISELKEKLKAGEIAQKLAVNEATSPKDTEIEQLKAKLTTIEIAQKLAITEAVDVVRQERDTLTNSLEKAALERKLSETSLKERYDVQIKDRDDHIERLRDMRLACPQKWSGKRWNSTVTLNSTGSERQHFPEPISRRTMTREAEARGTLSFVTATKAAQNSSRSCLT